MVLNETRNLTEAATRLHMTQPALSHWLADAEQAVGRALFLRDRRLSLTVDGEVVLAHAQRMLGDVQRTHAELQAVRQGLQGRLNVGTGLPRVLLAAVHCATARGSARRIRLHHRGTAAQPAADVVAARTRRDHRRRRRAGAAIRLHVRGAAARQRADRRRARTSFARACPALTGATPCPIRGSFRRRAR